MLASYTLYMLICLLSIYYVTQFWKISLNVTFEIHRNHVTTKALVHLLKYFTEVFLLFRILTTDLITVKLSGVCNALYIPVVKCDIKADFPIRSHIYVICVTMH